MALGRSSLAGLHWPTHGQTMAKSRRLKQQEGPLNWSRRRSGRRDSNPRPSPWQKRCWNPSIGCCSVRRRGPRPFRRPGVLPNLPRSNTRHYGSLGFGLPTRFLGKGVPRDSGSPGHYGDCALQQGNPAYSCIRGDQGRTEILGESDVTSVVGRDIGPKLPDPVEEGEDRITDQPKLPPGVECRPSNCFIDLS